MQLFVALIKRCYKNENNEMKKLKIECTKTQFYSVPNSLNSLVRKNETWKEL
jgi:hypothetical protein